MKDSLEKLSRLFGEYRKRVEDFSRISYFRLLGKFGDGYGRLTNYYSHAAGSRNFPSIWMELDDQKV